MPSVTAPDGLAIAVHELGGVGPTLLLDHATGFHGRVWAPLAGALADRYRCLALDHRAHGDSASPPPGTLTWDDLASDTATVVDQVGPERPFALGHSMGGACLLVTEARRPGTYAAIAVYEPIIFPPERDDGERPSPLVEGARRRRPDFASFEDAEQNYARKPPLDALRADALRAYVRHGLRATDGRGGGGVTLKCRPADEARVFESARDQTWWDVLPAVRCPVLVMHGTTATPTGIEGVARHGAPLAEHLPAGERLGFEDLGHLGPLEQPERVAEAVATFFARQPPAPEVARA